MRERYSQEGSTQQNLLEEKSTRYTKEKNDDDIENLRLLEDIVCILKFLSNKILYIKLNIYSTKKIKS